MPSLMDDEQFLQELEKLVIEPNRAERTLAPAPAAGFWSPEPRFTANGDALETAEEESDLESFFEPELTPAVEPAAEPEAAVAPRPQRRNRLELTPSVRRESGPREEPLPIRRGFAEVAPASGTAPAVAAVAEALEQREYAAAAQHQGVPRIVAALVIVACVGTGAGASAYVFRDRVSQIVTSWSARTR